jgi:hypothetical protein
LLRGRLNPSVGNETLEKCPLQSSWQSCIAGGDETVKPFPLDARPSAREDAQRFVLDHLLHFLPGHYVMLSAYLDESGTHGNSPAMCVAGLLYTEEAVRQLDQEWKSELEQAGIRYFHAVEEAHLTGAFKGRQRSSIGQLYQRLVGIIKKHALGGMGVYTIPEKQFDKFRQGRWEYSQYTTCAYICMWMLMEIAKRHGHERVSFIVESGHKNMGELNTLVKELRGAGWVMEACQFNDKRDLRPLQTADVWAYELAKHASDRLASSTRRVRKSLEALISENLEMQVLILNKERLEYFFDRYSEQMSR